eukprot:9745444-Alexandrium_andersonii.AAC.1
MEQRIGGGGGSVWRGGGWGSWASPAYAGGGPPDLASSTGPTGLAPTTGVESQVGPLPDAWAGWSPGSGAHAPPHDGRAAEHAVDYHLRPGSYAQLDSESQP